jgi:hypothetical protein
MDEEELKRVIEVGRKFTETMQSLTLAVKELTQQWVIFWESLPNDIRQKIIDGVEFDEK